MMLSGGGAGRAALVAGAGAQLWWSTVHERPWWPVMAMEERPWWPELVPSGGVHGSREALVARDGDGRAALVAGAGAQRWWSTVHERPWWPVMAMEERPWWPELVPSGGVHSSREALVARDGGGRAALAAFGGYLVILKIRGGGMCLKPGVCGEISSVPTFTSPFGNYMA